MQKKKLNKRQLAWSKKKVNQARIGLYRNFFLVVIGIVVLSVIAAAMTCSPVDWDAIVTVITGGSGLTWATMATIGNLGEISDKESAPNQIAMRLWLIAIDQVDQTETFPTPNSDRELSTIPLIAGQVPHYMDAIDNTQDENSTAAKGEITTDFTNTLIYIVAGNRAKHLDFIEEYIGKGFIIIYQMGEDATKYIRGSLYKPMILQNVDRKGGGKEGKYITFTFQNKYWRQPLIYVGAIATEAPTTVAADATNLTIGTASQYQLSDGTGAAAIATVSGIGSSDYGRVIEVLAPATDAHAPTIADNTVFILVDGTTWTANPGSRISFKILDDTTLVEVAGTRVQTA